MAYIALCSSHQVTSMAKHIDFIHHFVTERVQLRKIKFNYITSSMNIADVLTKTLFKPLLKQHRAALRSLTLL